MEAERLAVYFEETGAYHHKKMKEAEIQSPTNSDISKEKQVVFELGGDEEEEYEYGNG